MYREHPLFSNPQVSFNNPKYSSKEEKTEKRSVLFGRILCFPGKKWNVILYFDSVSFLFFPFVQQSSNSKILFTNN